MSAKAVDVKSLTLGATLDERTRAAKMLKGTDFRERALNNLPNSYGRRTPITIASEIKDDFQDLEYVERRQANVIGRFMELEQALNNVDEMRNLYFKFIPLAEADEYRTPHKAMLTARKLLVELGDACVDVSTVCSELDHQLGILPRS